VKARGSGLPCQPGLHSRFKASPSYIAKPCLKKKGWGGGPGRAPEFKGTEMKDERLTRMIQEKIYRE
jgi:hypothetical protein